MRQLLIFIGFSLLLFIGTNAQTIDIEKVRGGYKFTQSGENLTLQGLKTALASNEEATRLYKSSRASNFLGQVIAGTGGFLVGYPVGTAIGGGEPNWTLAAIGAGVIAVAIPISLGSNKQLVKAVETYNADEGSTSMKGFQPKLELRADVNGFGLRMNF